MYYNCLVNIPKNTGKISRNKRGKTTYIEYTYAREYLPEKKYNVARRTTIGKADPDHPGMMFLIPTSKSSSLMLRFPPKERRLNLSIVQKQLYPHWCLL